MATLHEHSCCLEDLDVFTIPHNRMKHLLTRVSQRAHCTDFTSNISFCLLLTELSSTFQELKQHEEIENKYVMKVLKRKLHGEALKKLLIHLHAHSHISDIIKHIESTERKFRLGEFTDLQLEGKKIVKAMQDFFDEYLPHMTEEEQVLQPMLMEFLPTDKLRQIKDTVLHLHHLKGLEESWKTVESSFHSQFEKLHVECKLTFAEEKSCVKVNYEEVDIKSQIELLPEELVINIFSYLSAKDLCRCSMVSTEWNRIAFTGGLWNSLHLSRWGLGDWTSGRGPASDECNCDCEPNYDMMMFLDYAEGKHNDRSNLESGNLVSSDSEDSLDDSVKREVRILNGVSRYVLPRVGESVKMIVLECSKAITNGMLFRILSRCRNLEYIDVSQTIISDLGLMGLFKVGCQRLQHLDVSGCKNITDKVLMKLSSALGRNSKVSNNGDLIYENGRQLKKLRLSGCFKITDNGLRSLAKYGGLPQLRHLDLSGCFNISAAGIRDLVSACPKLEMQELFYCDNIPEVPNEVSGEASCCQNQGCLNRVCCRNQQE